MPLIKAYYIISAVAVVHLAMGYYLIAAPEKIATQSTIFILGEALGLQQPRSSLYENPLACAFAGLVLILSAISDLTTVSGAEDVARDYWGAQAPVRTLFFVIVTGYAYVLKPGRGNVSATSDHPLINSAIFSWAFMEAIWWFWIHTNLREERGEAMARIHARKKAKLEMEMRED
ncbi:increased loss of mitochondrial DNA protein 1 [Tricharina praecox]|uniref:increased loss of mitochondrial DNA protein 1 n=1 Tax=Tricharina praecox TaxID=43433 RepID=UPI00221F51CD|nr:increased loss of mitochondrial DNA protein 1 [Tricharina praecox]KAI5850139.1 increased loss of mitochondrial DNA protein 1 [Tricharina praecox]